MQELAQENFHVVKPLLEGGYAHPEIVSVIEHNNPGWIFVDDFSNLKSALVWSKGIEGFYLIGEHENKAFVSKLDRYIKRTLEPRIRKFSLNQFEVSGHHDEWDMESIFSTRDLHKFEQLVFKLMKSPQVFKSNHFQTINLKTNNWENQEFQNKSLIMDHLQTFWRSINDFKNKGFGYAAVKGKEIIGVGYSSFVTHDTHAIGIEVMDSFQNKGIGTNLASLLVENIYNNGFIPYWDCSVDNEPSKMLAERLGFTLIHQYTCSVFQL